MKKNLFLMTLIMTFSLTVSFCSYAGSNTTAYSPYWIIDSGNNWHYKLANGTVINDSWIHDEVSGDTYLIDKTGNMSSGLVMSDGRYYLLDNTRGTGHFGKLMKNGEIYNGITIYADTSASYQGALNDITLNQLAQMGLSVYGAQNVTGTKHVSNGTIVSGGSGTAMIGTTVSDPTLQQTNAGAVMGVTNANRVNNGNTGATSNLFNLSRVERLKKNLSQSEINTLVAQGVPYMSQIGSSAFPPYSENGYALMNFIDSNEHLVLAGDRLKVGNLTNVGGSVQAGARIEFGHF